MMHERFAEDLEGTVSDLIHLFNKNSLLSNA